MTKQKTATNRWSNEPWLVAVIRGFSEVYKNPCFCYGTFFLIQCLKAAFHTEIYSEFESFSRCFRQDFIQRVEGQPSLREADILQSFSNSSGRRSIPKILKILMRIAFTGKINLIFSISFIVYKECCCFWMSSFEFSTIYDPKTTKLPRQCPLNRETHGVTEDNFMSEINPQQGCMFTWWMKV